MLARRVSPKVVPLVYAAAEGASIFTGTSNGSDNNIHLAKQPGRICARGQRSRGHPYRHYRPHPRVSCSTTWQRFVGRRRRSSDVVAGHPSSQQAGAPRSGTGQQNGVRELLHGRAGLAEYQGRLRAQGGYRWVFPPERRLVRSRDDRARKSRAPSSGRAREPATRRRPSNGWQPAISRRRSSADRDDKDDDHEDDVNHVAFVWSLRTNVSFSLYIVGLTVAPKTERRFVDPRARSLSLPLYASFLHSRCHAATGAAAREKCTSYPNLVNPDGTVHAFQCRTHWHEREKEGWGGCL